ncbi:MAG TPA: hypothetical protein VI007_03455 [bacterium]
MGSRNPINQARATLEALSMLRQPETVARVRGKAIEEVAAFRR